jgi:hypothetical protein
VNSSQPDERPTPRHRGEARPRYSHHERLAAAQEDLDSVADIDLATATRAQMALAFERIRGGLADVIRMEMEHHPRP